MELKKVRAATAYPEPQLKRQVPWADSHPFPGGP